jgi:hypothetical protein
MQQHLYVVVDDWERGYSVHKFDEDDFGPDLNAVGGMDTARPVVRMEALHPHSWSLTRTGARSWRCSPRSTAPASPCSTPRRWGWRCGPTHYLNCRQSTFAFDMERHEWTHVGEWLLPFKGQAHYDREPDAWVGLCLYKQGSGRVCCCDIPAPDGASGGGGGETSMPAWKLGRDVLFEKRTPANIWAPRSCTWAIADSAWLRGGCPRTATSTRAPACSR